MSERDGGFLWENERRYIDNSERTESDEFEPRKVKSLLKNEGASAITLGETFRAFRTDLERIEWFWTREMADGGHGYYWDDVVLPANEDEIRRLRDLCDSWLTRTEIDFVEREDEFLADHLYPLWQDLDLDVQSNISPVRYLFGEFEQESVTESDLAPHAELIARRDVLLRIVAEPELCKLVLWIAAHPRSKIPKNEPYKNNDWRWAASRLLKTDLGLLVNWGSWDHVYEFTELGEVILETLRTMVNSDAREISDLSEEEIVRAWSRLLHQRRME